MKAAFDVAWDRLYDHLENCQQCREEVSYRISFTKSGRRKSRKSAGNSIMKCLGCNSFHSFEGIGLRCQQNIGQPYRIQRCGHGRKSHIEDIPLTPEQLRLIDLGTTWRGKCPAGHTSRIGTVWSETEEPQVICNEWVGTPGNVTECGLRGSAQEFGWKSNE